MKFHIYGLLWFWYLVLEHRGEYTPYNRLDWPRFQPMEHIGPREISITPHGLRLCTG